MFNQRTIKDRVVLEGIGLHIGKPTKIELLPAQANTGILFVRKDISNSPIIKADISYLASPQKFPRRTSVGVDGVYVHTIEHLMSALSILMVDNLQINIWGEEIPGLDGSAKIFVDKIKEVGVVEQNLPKNYLVIKEPLWVQEEDATIVILPYPYMRFSYILKYDHPQIGYGYVDLVLNGNLEDNFYEARTFCLEEEVESLLNMGLGKGSNYENTLVVSSGGIINNELRIPDEFAKHKLLDLIGDLYLAGPFKGYVIAVKSGHSLNIKLLDKIYRYKERMKIGGVGSYTSFIPQRQELDIKEIMQILPHRYPFLLVDRITYLDKGKKAIGIKNVSINEFFFEGHFPKRPVMPGVLIIEAMAQVGGVLMLACEENKNKLAYFMAANNIKFRKVVLPGDQLVIEVEAGKVKSKTGTVYAKAFVEDKLVAEAELMFALVES